MATKRKFTNKESKCSYDNQDILLTKMHSQNSKNLLKDYDAIVIFHLATSGDQDDDAGCDESPIVLITAKILDLSNLEGMPLEKQILVGIYPSTSGEEEYERMIYQSSVSKESEEVLGISEILLKNRPTFPEALNEVSSVFIVHIRIAPTELDEWLRTHGLQTDEHGKTNFCFVCDGPVSMRVLLHPNLVKWNINDFKNFRYFLSYIDIREAVQMFLNLENQICGVVPMCHYLNLDLPYIPKLILERISCMLTEEVQKMLRDREINLNTEEGVGLWPREHCRSVSRILVFLIRKDFRLEKLQEIQAFYQPALVSKNENIDDATIVRTRGLPWQTTDGEIHQFFRGISIANGGIAIVLGKAGRRNGEALIRFENSFHRDLALRRHKHHMGQRYIEIYIAQGKEFLSIASAETEGAENFIKKMTSSSQAVIRIRGLPYDAVEQDIINFFEPVNCPIQFQTEGILFVKRRDGKSTGDAFVLFADSEIADRALTNHRQNIGSRYVELFKSTPAEINQVMNAVHCTQQQVVSICQMLKPTSDCGYSSLGELVKPNNPLLELPITSVNASSSRNVYSNVSLFTPGVLSNGIDQINLNHFVSPNFIQMPGRYFVKIKGLPKSACIDELLVFLDWFCNLILPHGIHSIKNNLGEFTGEAVIEMCSEMAAKLLIETKHRTLIQSQCGDTFLIELNICDQNDWLQLEALNEDASLKCLMFPQSTNHFVGGQIPNEKFSEMSSSYCINDNQLFQEMNLLRNKINVFPQTQTFSIQHNSLYPSSYSNLTHFESNLGNDSLLYDHILGIYYGLFPHTENGQQRDDTI